ncbi:hypothetical protein B0T09DRAFT_315729 [Sordaria sp. MPI-SDFR-AT-0083]|nr:hypothetical protein B0T09DRAFT_315729 [Sordaria sp. MPI-SDFR-AT-0083]
MAQRQQLTPTPYENSKSRHDLRLSSYHLLDNIGAVYYYILVVPLLLPYISNDPYVKVKRRPLQPLKLALLSALHAYVPLITANPYLKTYQSLPLPSSSAPSPAFSDSTHLLPTPPSLTDDPQFFQPPGPDGFNPQSYLITDSVPLLPLPDWLGGGSLLGSKEVSVPCTFQSFGYGVRCKAVAAAGVVVRSSYEVRHRYRPKPAPQLPAQVQSQAQAQAQAQTPQNNGQERQGRESNEGLGQGLRAGLRKGGSDDIANHKSNSRPNSSPTGVQGGKKLLINKVTGTSIENYEYELVEIATVECPAIVRPFVKAKFEKGHQEVLQRVVDRVVAGWMEELRSSKGTGTAWGEGRGQGRGRTLLQEIQQQG